MGEWKHFFALMKSNRLDVIVLLTTFLLTVLFDLILAIEVGLVLSSFIFMKRMSEKTGVFKTNDENGEVLFEQELHEIPKRVQMYEINGPLFFGASQKFQEVLTDLNQNPKVLILRMRNVPFIDATGIKSLKQVCKFFQLKGTTIIISGASRSVKLEILKAGMYALIGKNNILNSINEAIERGKTILAEENKM